METSVVIVAYRRYETLEPILKAWLSETPDVWLCDCGEGYETILPINIIRFTPDPGNRSRHAIATLTSGDFVIKADDDLLPEKGFIADLRKGLIEAGSNGMCGVIGRKFNGESYYNNTTFYASSKVKEIQEVDFVGVTTFSPRAFLAFDLKGCLSPIEDLFWQMKAFPRVPKYVIPTEKYQNLKIASDKDCLFHDKEARILRETFYREYYLKNYKKE